MEIDNFVPLDKPIQFGYLAGADGLGRYPKFRYRGTERMIVHDTDEESAAAADGFHQIDYGRFEPERTVDYGSDLTQLDPVQLQLYAHDIGLALEADTVGECVARIQDYLLSKPSYQGRMTLIAQEIEFDYKGAQDEIRDAVKQAGGYLI